MLSTFTDYRILTSNYSATVEKKAAEPSNKKEIQYFKDNIGKVKTVDDFLGNQRLYTFAMKAYGLDDMISNKGFMKKVLTGATDASGKVLADSLEDSRFQDFAKAFNFRQYGEDPSQPAKLDDDTQSLIEESGGVKTVQQQQADYDTETESAEQYVRDMTQYIKTTDDIVSDSKLSAFVRTAVGLPPASADDDAWTQAQQIESKFDVSTLQDPNAMVGLFDNYEAARRDGRKALTDPYYRSAGTYAASDAEVAKLTDYARTKLKTVTSAQDIVNDPALADVVGTALGLPADLTSRKSDEQVKLITEKLDVSTLSDSKTLDGLLDDFKDARDDAQTAIVDSYVEQTLETDAGEDNEGTRLALYFRRKIGSVKSAYGILADSALAEVVRTATGLPAESAKSSIDTQARQIESKVDLKSLSDPAKLDQFIKRFTILWDNKSDTTTSPALSILTGGGSTLDPDVLVTLQNIRSGSI